MTVLPLAYAFFFGEDHLNRELLWVLSLLLIAILLFSNNKLHMDVVALLVIIAFVLSGTLTLSDALVGFSDPNVILIAALFVIGEGLVRTGVAYQVGEWLIRLAGGAGPQVMLVCLFVLCATIGLFISNTATAVLMAPIAIAAAKQMGVSPYPFAMIVAIAASAAFMTPVSSPVNTLVLGPGGYRFGDFVKVGVPFTVLVMIVSVIMVPWLYGF